MSENNYTKMTVVEEENKVIMSAELYEQIKRKLERLEAYENADIIKIDDAIRCVNFTGRWLLSRKERKTLERAETLIRKIPRFEP